MRTRIPYTLSAGIIDRFPHKAIANALMMADSSCSGSTPFKGLVDHGAQDRSLHRDRFSSTPSLQQVRPTVPPPCSHAVLLTMIGLSIYDSTRLGGGSSRLWRIPRFQRDWATQPKHSPNSQFARIKLPSRAAIIPLISGSWWPNSPTQPLRIYVTNSNSFSAKCVHGVATEDIDLGARFCIIL